MSDAARFLKKKKKIDSQNLGLTGLNQNQIEVFCLFFFFEFVAKISNIYITLGGDLKISEQNNWGEPEQKN